MYQYTERAEKKQVSKSMPRIPKKPSVQVVQRVLKQMNKDEDFSEFIMLKDKKPITRYCMEKHYAISFRCAGRHTIDKLQKGAAAKGHHILEKSIKETSVNDQKIFQYIPKELLGLVAHWGSDTSKGIMRLEGLYMSRAGLKRLGIKKHNKNQAVTFNEFKKIFSSWQIPKSDVLPEGLPDDISEQEIEQLKILNQIANMIRSDNRAAKTAKTDTSPKPFTYADFITGDYDIHDLVYIAPGKSARSVNSHPDFAVAKGLNAAMNGGREKPRSEYDRIQHGAQMSYNHYMSGHPNEKPVLSLLEPDGPIAMCAPDGKWYRIIERKELEEFYTLYGININTVWPEGDSLEEQKEGLTFMHKNRSNSRRRL